MILFPNNRAFLTSKRNPFATTFNYLQDSLNNVARTSFQGIGGRSDKAGYPGSAFPWIHLQERGRRRIVKFPEWAPPNLVSAYTGKNGTEIIGKEVREALFRLLTNPEMEGAWREVRKGFTELEIVSLTFFRAMAAYTYNYGRKRPPKSVRIENLERVSRAAIELARALEGSDYDNDGTAFRWWTDNEVSRAWERIGKRPDVPHCMLLHGREDEDVVFTPGGHLENHFAEESPSLIQVLRRLSKDAESKARAEQASRNIRSKYYDVAKILSECFKDRLE